MTAPDLRGLLTPPPRERLFGLYPAVVTDVVDPAAQGRVQVRLPWVDEADGAVALAWARLSTLMAGPGRGTWFVPDVGDEVVIAFLGGDPRWPIVTGALWNGADAPPEVMDAHNNLRSITTRSGHRLQFDDRSGAERVELRTQGGHSVLLNDGDGEIVVTHAGGAELKIVAGGKVIVNSPLAVEVNAVQLTVNAPVAKFSGLVQADTVVTNTVVASAYTPGSGNVW